MAQAAFRGRELCTDHPSGEHHTGEMAVGLYAAPRKSRFGKSREQLKHGPFQEPAIADCRPPDAKWQASGKWLCCGAHPTDLGLFQQALQNDGHQVDVLMTVQVNVRYSGKRCEATDLVVDRSAELGAQTAALVRDPRGQQELAKTGG